MIWAQNCNAVNRVSILQKKALGIVSFQPRDCHSSPLFKRQNLLKFEDKIKLENVLLVSKYLNNILPSIFDNWFTLFLICIITTQVNYWNRHSEQNSITIRAVNAWNKILTTFGDVILKNLTTTQIKTLLTKKCIGKYWQYFTQY